MANLKVTLELDNSSYMRNVRGADAATKDFARGSTAAAQQVDGAFDKLNARTEKLAVAFGRLKGIVIGAAFAVLSRSAIQSADAIADLSSATEISIGRIIELQQALQASGGEAANTGKLITEFYKSLDEAAQGSDRTQDAFARVGVSLKDLGTLSTADLLDKTVKGFENITDPAQRTALALQLFGKAAQNVNLNEFGSNMDSLRGQFEEQRRAVEQTAIMVGNFEKATDNLRMAFLTVTAPLVDFVNNLAKGKAEMETLITLLKGLAVVVAAAFALTGFGLVVRVIGTIGRGVGSLVGLFTNVGTTISRVFGANSTAMKILRGVGGLIAGIAGGLAAAVGLGGGGSDGQETTGGSTQPGTMGAYVSRERKEPVSRPVETGKELVNQLNTVQSLADGYRRAAQANMDRMTTEVSLLGLSREEQEIIKGTAEINKRYADQTAALEEKRKGAKGATLALINKEIADLEDLRTSELDIFGITQQQTSEYARQQQQVKNIIDLMEQQAEYAKEIAEYQNAQGQAVMAAFEQVQAQREAFELVTLREQMERNIVNMRGEDQAAIRALVDLEAQRLEKLEAIKKIQNLPFEGVGGQKQRMQEINELYDQRRQQIETNLAKTKEEQASFSAGWAAAGQKFRNNIKTDAEYAAESMTTLTKGLEDAFVKFVQTGKISIKGLVNSMIADFARVQAQKAISSLFSGGFGGGGGGGLFGGAIIPGFLANGGPAAANEPYVVGERGPELFVPNNAGRVIPNHSMGGGSNTVVNNSTAVSYSISAVDAQSFKSLLARDPEFLHNVAEQGRRSMPIRSRV